MNSFSSGRKSLSIILKLITIISAVTGVYLSTVARHQSFMSGSRGYMYFTIQSNILIAMICAVGLALLIGNKKPGRAWFVIKFVGTVSITLTGVVFAVLLAPLLGANAWSARNTLTHLVVPITAVADFFVIAKAEKIKRRDVIFVIIPPLLYAVYAAVGYVRGWEFATGTNYPYFFLNWGSPAGAFGLSDELPFLGTVWWILILLFFLIGVGHVYRSVVYAMEKRCMVSGRADHGHAG